MYDLACEVRGKFGFSWTDAIMIARNVRDCEARPVAGHDIAAWKAFEKAEAECIVAFMERDGIDPAHVEEVRQLLL